MEKKCKITINYYMIKEISMSTRMLSSLTQGASKYRAENRAL